MSFGVPIVRFPDGDEYYGFGTYGDGTYGGLGSGGFGIPAADLDSGAQFGQQRFQESLGLRFGQVRSATSQQFGSLISIPD